MPTPNNIKDFRSLYTLQLRYLLSAENQIVKGLDSMIEHASDEQVVQAFESHRQETEVHIARLEEMISEVNDGNIDDKKDCDRHSTYWVWGQHCQRIRGGSCS